MGHVLSLKQQTLTTKSRQERANVQIKRAERSWRRSSKRKGNGQPSEGPKEGMKELGGGESTMGLEPSIGICMAFRGQIQSC